LVGAREVQLQSGDAPRAGKLRRDLHILIDGLTCNAGDDRRARLAQARQRLHKERIDAVIL
jgi:hypothetical protein